MGDNFDLKKYLLENRLGAYSKAKYLNEDDYDTKRDLIGALGSNPTVQDVADYLKIPYNEAESLMKRLGMGRYTPSSAPGGGFRSTYRTQSADYRRQKALEPKTSLAIKDPGSVAKYAIKAGNNLDIYSLATSSSTADEFIAAVIDKMTSQRAKDVLSASKNALVKYYNDMNK